MRRIKRFVRALGYFTIVPVGAAIDGPPEPEDVAFLPLVGACVGLASGSIAYASSFFVPRRVAAAIAYAMPIVLTGALHLDGFLDICDAAFASVDLAKRREILRDPRHGSFAFAGGSILALANYAALREIEPHNWPQTIAIASAVARQSALIAAAYRRPDGSGTAARAFASRPRLRDTIVQSSILMATAFALKRSRGALSVAGVFTATFPIAGFLSSRFGSTLGGDAYGFLISIAEVAVLTGAGDRPK